MNRHESILDGLVKPLWQLIFRRWTSNLADLDTGTVIDRVALDEGGWRNRHSTFRLAVKSAEDCLQRRHATPMTLTC